MKVRFNADYRDYGKTAYLIWKKNNPESNEQFKFFVLFAFIAAITSIPALLFAPHFIYPILNFCIVFALGYAFYKPVNLSYFVKFYHSVYGQKSYQIELELFENGVEILMPAAKVFYEWQHVIDFNETEENLVLLFKYQTGISVPKNAFQMIAEIGNFVAFTKAHISTDQPKQLDDRNSKQSAQN